MNPDALVKELANIFNLNPRNVEEVIRRHSLERFKAKPQSGTPWRYEVWDLRKNCVVAVFDSDDRINQRYAEIAAKALNGAT